MDKKCPEIEIMIMGGTEAYFLDRGDIGLVVDEIDLETPYGMANKISIIELGEKYVGFMSRHGEHGYSVSAPFVNSRANIYAGKELGCKRILSWNGAGAISQHIIPGDYVIIDDYIDMTKKREYTYYVNKGFGFIRQNPAFCPELSLIHIYTIDYVIITACVLTFCVALAARIAGWGVLVPSRL